MICLWTALALAAPEDLPVPEVPAILITTGGTHGIAGGSWQIGDGLSKMDATSVRAIHGAMARDRTVVIAKDGRVETVATVLSGTPCEDPEPAFATRTPYDLIVGDSSAGGAYQRWSCGEVWWYSPADQPPSEDRSGFEFRLTVRAELEDKSTVYVASLPVGGAPRRIGRILELKEQYPAAMFVDSGSFVDGVSTVRDQMPSLHRPALFDALRRMEPSALAPGANELAMGARAFLAEADGLPYVATNWVTEDPALGVPSFITVDIDTGGENATFAFLSAIDPALLESIPALAREGITLSDPVDAIQAAVAKIDADVVVVLAEGRHPWMSAIEHMPGVDIIVGDAGPALDRIASFDAQIVPGRTSAWTMPIDGIGVSSLYLNDHGLTRIVGYPEVLWAQQAPDLTVLEKVNQVRFGEYPEHDRPLLPPPADRPTQAYSRDVWDKLICEATLEYSDAHVALLPTLPQGVSVPGPLTELLVLEQLNLPDVLQIHWVRGENLARTLDQAHGAAPVSCGATLGNGKDPVAGRGIDPQRLYRIVTTDGARLSARLEGLLAASRSTRALDLPSWKTLEDDGGPVTLRAAVLEVLRGHSDDDPVAVFTSRNSGDVNPLWLLRLDNAALSLVSFTGPEDPRYAAIPETLATSPSSLTLLADLDVGLDYSSAQFRADLRNKTSFSELRSGGEVSEPADDLVFSSSVALPAAFFPVIVNWYPYSEALFDSELTPLVDEEGVVGSRQADLSLTAGIMASQGALSRIRFGAFALQEMGNLDKQPEFGGRSEVATTVGFGPSLVWTTSLDAYLFFDSPDQDQTDLRLKGLATTRLDLPLARWLSISPWGQAFAFAGRVPETRPLAVSWTSGVALNMSGAFEL